MGRSAVNGVVLTLSRQNGRAPLHPDIVPGRKLSPWFGVVQVLTWQHMLRPYRPIIHQAFQAALGP